MHQNKEGKMEIRELDNDIKSGKLKNIYFFYGPETFLIENKINSIKKRVVLQQYEDMNFSSFSFTIIFSPLD